MIGFEIPCLWCQWPKAWKAAMCQHPLIWLQEGVSLFQSEVSAVWCWGLGIHYSPGITDVDHVRNGTPCAPGKFCLDNSCNATLEAINNDCDPKVCNHRGICNNRKHCHCHVGCKPPLCLSRGEGGSMESGPTARETCSVKQKKDPLFIWDWSLVEFMPS